MDEKKKIEQAEVDSRLKKDKKQDTTATSKDSSVSKKTEEKISEEKVRLKSQSKETAGIDEKDKEKKLEEQIAKESPVTDSKVGKEKFEEKINQNLKTTREIREKIREKENEMEILEEEKQKETFMDKIKNVLYFCPKLCVEANVCKYPKIICKGCKALVDSSLASGENGVKYVGALAVKCTDSLTSNVKLPVIRRKIKKKFQKLGDIVYQMYLNGEKDTTKNKEFEKCIDRLKKYEKEIEELEAHMIKTGEPALKEQKA